MRPRLSARLLFALIGAVGCLVAALALEGAYAALNTGRWVDRREAPVLLFFPRVRSETERRLEEAGAHSGDVEITLAWNNLNDLDLHCIAPDGEEISYELRRPGRSGGALDVDRNAGPPFTTTPVEHIYWPRGRAPAGTYRVYVDHFGRHGGTDPTAYQVTVSVYGKTTHYNGEIVHDDTPQPKRLGRLVCTFTAAGAPSHFLGLAVGQLRALLVVALWASLVVSVLSVALLMGLLLFYRNVYRRRFLRLERIAEIALLSAPLGALSGAAAQALYTYLAGGAMRVDPTTAHAVGMALLGGCAGLSLGGRIRHLPRGRAILAGLAGGAMSGWLLMQIASRGPDWAARIVAAVVLGASIGLMIALVVEEPEEPVEIADAAIADLAPLSLRANSIGPAGTLRRAGR